MRRPATLYVCVDDRVTGHPGVLDPVTAGGLLGDVLSGLDLAGTLGVEPESLGAIGRIVATTSDTGRGVVADAVAAWSVVAIGRDGATGLPVPVLGRALRPRAADHEATPAESLALVDAP